MNALITRLTRAGLRQPWLVLAIAFAITGGSVWLASGLEVRSSFEELLPSDVPSVRNVKELVRRVGGDGTVLLSVEAKDGPQGLAGAKALAPTLAKELLALGPDTIRSVEWNVKPTEDYFANHWPLFLSTDQLQQAYDALDHAIAARKHKAVELDLGLDGEAVDAGPLTFESPDGGAATLDPNGPTPRQRVAERFARYDDGFLVHPDKTSLTLVVRPAGTALGVDEAKALLARMHAVVDSHQKELDEAHLRVGFGGTFPLFVAEYEAILRDVASTALLCLSLVLGSLFLFFRDLRSTLSLGATVLMAVAATFGITRLVIGYLNTQTAFLGSIVVGNGINYGLIYLARVRQLRRAGVGLEPAAIEGAVTAARATLLASAASSVSFAMLILAANRGFRHFGFIGGVGMLLCWLFTFALLPAMLAVWEKILPMKAAAAPPSPVRPAPAWLKAVFAKPGALVFGFGVALVVSIVVFVRQAPTAIERNLENLTNELKGAEVATLKRDNLRANQAMGRSSAGAIALLPSVAEADAFCAVVRGRMGDPRFAPVVDGCDTLSSVVPSNQPAKLAIAKKLHDRISDAVLDALPKDQAQKLRDIKADLGAQTLVDVTQAPPTLVDRFREKDGTLGRLAVATAKPDAKLELGPNLQAFVDAVRSVPVGNQSWDATGENVVFADLLHNIEVEGPVTTVGSLLGVCVLVALFLRRVRQSAEVLGALIAGVILMGGAAALLHLKINFFNFIVFPITFGIAVDYGANVVVRVGERGGDVLAALAEVGPAVALCSWTSMIGYGSLIIALNRALQSFGWYALVGEVTSIVAALVLLPALALLSNPAQPSPPPVENG
ncbi:MAG: MMPL family transporter [Deltaproteobacteria bacterium]|nr:MMPL family transporter [Deltaproteobacteria bacterium]